jgi:uncharacterized membrane protein YsdA (DUF1294 family)/cold shock CspA family protein
MTSKIGTITKWDDEKGFGFITPKSGGKQVFIHINDFNKKHQRPKEGLPVIFSLSKDKKGRLCASKVFPQNAEDEFSKADSQKLMALIISIIFICVLIALILLKKLPQSIMAIYFVASVITFILYATDKSAAQAGEWRTSESTLHLFSLVGGWPGAAIAQSFLRHKSKKIKFRVVYWITVIINCGILAWLLTPEGANQLEIILKDIKIW